MAVNRDLTKEIEEFKISEKDTGSTQFQILNLTQRISSISNHIKSNHKDHSSKRGLSILLGQRRRFLNYLKRKNKDIFEKISKIIKG